jgi:hypothetical protein
MIDIPPDTCTMFVIPATECSNNIKRAVYIVFEKDGTWHKEYHNRFEDKLLKAINKPKTNGK